MSREWKPGDVAMVNDLGLALVRIRKEATHNALEFVYANGGFDMVDDLADGYIVRPLVVIDPEDREQVERLVAAYDGNRTSDAAPVMQAALRSLITPPKPDEPTGLGAVVEDRYGRLWVRLNHLPSTEDPWKPYDSRTRRCAWADIAAVKILSDGVQP